MEETVWLIWGDNNKLLGIYADYDSAEAANVRWQGWITAQNVLSSKPSPEPEPSPAALVHHEAHIKSNTLTPGETATEDWGEVTCPECLTQKPVVHYCSATWHCKGGRNDTGNWSEVTCEDCLKGADAPRLMNWAAAGAYLLQGKTLARKPWHGEFVYEDEKRKQILHSGYFKNVYRPSASDLLARDWYILGS